jgi:hypothetical protein
MGEHVQQARRQQGLTAIARVVAFALASSSMPALARAPAPAPSEATVPEPTQRTESRGWAHVAVDTSETGEAGPAIRRRVQERADVVLRRAGVMPGRGPQDPTINVVVREKGGDKPGWEYTITVSRPDETTPSGEMSTCDLCTETELVDAIEGRLATVAAELEAEQSAARDPDDDVATDPTTTPHTDRGLPHDPKKLGKKGKAGAALIAIGGGGLVAGIVLAVLPAKDHPDMPTKNVYTDTPGYVVLGVGAAALITGVVLLALDRRAAKRQSKAHARVRLEPTAGLGFRF